jgi:hypothetical protein
LAVEEPFRKIPAAPPGLGEQGKGHQGSQSKVTSLAWVWQFSADGPPEYIRAVLAEHKMGVILKTHDGTRWMAQFDRSDEAVTEPYRVAQLAQYFEEAGVPFHAWCVLHGREPEREAWMCADVLDAGARSLVIDLEPYAGFWRASSIEAKIFGTELRKRHPNAFVTVSIDARPWQLGAIPLSEFAAFSNALAPQLYWEDFTSPGNIRGFVESGFPPGPDGVSPRFVLDVAQHVLSPYGLPVHPVGTGSTHENLWREFVEHAVALGSRTLSLWRFGTTNPAIWSVVKDLAHNHPLFA